MREKKLYFDELFEEFNNLRVFGNLPENDPEVEDGLFAFM